VDSWILFDKQIGKFFFFETAKFIRPGMCKIHKDQRQTMIGYKGAVYMRNTHPGQPKNSVYHRNLKTNQPTNHLKEDPKHLKTPKNAAQQLNRRGKKQAATRAQPPLTPENYTT